MKNKNIGKTLLIDIVQGWNDTTTEIDGLWYVARPLQFYKGYTLRHRIRDIINILRGKAFAVQFKEDRY